MMPALDMRRIKFADPRPAAIKPLNIDREFSKLWAYEVEARDKIAAGYPDRVACLLQEMVGAIRHVPIRIPYHLRGEMTPCNPSVCVHDGRRLAIVRGVNYRQAPGKRTLFVTRKDFCWTDDWWVEFDSDWETRDVRLMIDPVGLRPGNCQGYEDCRLFHGAGSFWASCTIAERPQLIGPGAFQMLLREMALLKISDDGMIEGVAAIRGPWSPFHQKNWRPICDGGEPRWIYTTNPLSIITTEDVSSPDDVRWWPWWPWRGSSQAIRVGNRWLWVDHRMLQDVEHLGNVYLHRFMAADSSLKRVVAMSRPFVFAGYGIEFCAGAAVDGDNLVLSYSTRDANASLAVMSLESALRTLRPVQ